MLSKACRVTFVAFVGIWAWGASIAIAEEGAVQGDGMAALRRAADAGKYLFIFFHQVNDSQTQAMRQVFDATAAKITERAECIVIDTKNLSERGIVEKFDARRSPMPLVLAIAPNGAITGGFPLQFTEELLMGAFVSRSTAECMKALQGGKMVFLCVQNDATKFAAETMEAVRAVQSDPKHVKTTAIVTVDPTDASEAKALERLKIDPKSDEAVTLFMVPPGTIISRFHGAASGKSLEAAVQSALVKAKGGCCPGGSCGPQKPATKVKAKVAKRGS